ncbi:MAG: hypothetical protein IPM25_18915 [Chloracidobacterium sp.]|nr:hypothetical protein [Chloracidobacterium sp.]
MSDETLESGYPGVGRLYYFLGRVMLIIVTIFTVVYFGPQSRVFAVVTLATMIAGAVLDVMRLRNIGVTSWLLFLKYLPYGALVLSIGLQTAQTGWVETKRLDRPGWAILATHAALIAVIIFLIKRSQATMSIPAFLPF